MLNFGHAWSDALVPFLDKVREARGWFSLGFPFQAPRKIRVPSHPCFRTSWPFSFLALSGHSPTAELNPPLPRSTPSSRQDIREDWGPLAESRPFNLWACYPRFISSALSHPFFGWEGSPTKIDVLKKTWYPYSILSTGGPSISTRPRKNR